jgi:hypothetical protein
VALKTDLRNAQAAVLIPLIAVPLGVLWRPFWIALPLLVFLIALERALRDSDQQNKNFAPATELAEQVVNPA